MKNDDPKRIDKIEYYRNLPLSQLLEEADYAETVINSTESVSHQKIQDSKIILEELKRRIS